MSNFWQNFRFLPLFWPFLTQIEALLPHFKKYQILEKVGIPTTLAALDGLVVLSLFTPDLILMFLLEGHEQKVSHINFVYFPCYLGETVVKHDLHCMV